DIPQLIDHDMMDRCRGNNSTSPATPPKGPREIRLSAVYDAGLDRGLELWWAAELGFTRRPDIA
ncbi:hypothetical protein KI387_022073, partial [Taxus chinensis]